QQLLRASPAQPALIVLATASLHTAHAVAAWLGEHPRVQLLSLPADSGQRRHPVETVWWRLTGQITAPRLHGSIDALLAAMHGFFHHLHAGGRPPASSLSSDELLLPSYPARKDKRRSDGRDSG